MFHLSLRACASVCVCVCDIERGGVLVAVLIDNSFLVLFPLFPLYLPGCKEKAVT